MSIGIDLKRNITASQQVAGLERLAPGVFFRMINNWKDGDVNAGKFKDFPHKETLPFRSVLHLLDNFNRLELNQSISDIPNLDHPFINNETARKLIYHQVTPMTDGWIKTPNDYIFRIPQLQRNLEKFRAQFGGKFVTRRKLEDFATMDTSLSIINHNPIFRLFCRGPMLNWRTTAHFMASMFNTVQAIPEKMHYFVIPLAPKIFVRGKFNQIARRITPGAVEDKTSYQYCFFAQLYNFMNVDCSLPTIFDSIPREDLSRICLVFEYAGHYLFWTLESLKSLNIRNKIYMRIFNHFNGFILRGLTEQNAQVNSLEYMDQLESDDVTANLQVEQEIAKSFSNITKIPIASIQSNNESYSEVDNEVSQSDIEELEKITRLVETLPLRMGDKSTVLDLSDIEDIINPTNEPEDLDDETDDSQSDDLDKSESDSADSDVGSDASKDVSREDRPVTESTEPAYYPDVEELETTILPNANLKIITDPAQMSDLGKSYLEKLDADSAKRIARDANLTMAQKERALRMSQSYKDVTFDGERVEDIISRPIDPVLDDVGTISTLSPDVVPDQGMIKSSVADMDKVYMDRLFKRHLVAVAASMSAQGMYLQTIEKTPVVNKLTQVEDYVFRYKSVHGKSHSVKFTFPTIRPDGTFVINGVRSKMSKQPAGRPIAKISATRVSLASNYNKTIVEKLSTGSHDFLVYFSDLLNQIQTEVPAAISDLESGVHMLPMDFICGYEYGELAKKFHTFTIHHQTQKAKTCFYFGPIDTRRESEVFKRDIKLSSNDWNKIEAYEKANSAIFVGVKVGTAPYTPAALYMDLGSRLHLVGNYQGKPFNARASILDYVQGATGVTKTKILTEWTDIKILDGKFPVGFLLCYRFGLLNMLRRLNIKYQIVDSHKVREARTLATDIVIRFADRKNLIIPRYPLKTSLIMQGLAMYNTRQGALEDYDHKEIYYQLLLDKKPGAGKTNYLIGIDDTFDMFIDPPTFDRLKQMGEPTTFDGLLVRATEMLTVPYHKESSAMANHYIRSYERLPAILYNEMAAQMRIFRKQRGPAATFSTNPRAVLQRIIQDPTVSIVEDINPIHDIKETTKLSYLGAGGRTVDSFVAKDRKFPKDGLGVLTESTPAAANVGIVTQSSMNPVFGNIYGLVEPVNDPNALDPTQMLSVSALLLPGLTQDDPKRAAFASTQLSHVVPIADNQVLRTRTGYEKLIAHRCNDLYAFTAKQDGIVVDVNDALKLAKIQYKDGTIESMSYDTQFGQCSDVVIEHQQTLTIKKGDKFKQHDVLRYNPQFFEEDIDDPRQVNYKLGTIARVILIENSRTFEDSNAISRDMSARLTIAPTSPKPVSLPATAVVHEYKNIGDEVEIATPLLIFERDDVTDLSGITTDEASLAYLEQKNRQAPKAKARGTIVDIDVTYACELKDMHPSMASMIRKYTAPKNAIAKYVENADNKYLFPSDSKVPVGSKIEGVTIDENTIYIKYLIRESMDSRAGDKVVIDSSLKTVTCEVLDVAPVTESGKPVDVIFSASSESNRIVNSPLLVGLAETVMAHLETVTVEEYFGKGAKIVGATERLHGKKPKHTPTYTRVDANYLRDKQNLTQLQSWAKSLSTSKVDKTAEQFLAKNYGEVYVVGIEDDISAGYCVLQSGDPLCKHVLILRELYIDPLYQSQGIGRQTIAFVEQQARARRKAYVTIGVEAANYRAHQLYNSQGYKEFTVGFMSKQTKRIESKLPVGWVLYSNEKELTAVQLNALDKFYRTHHSDIAPNSLVVLPGFSWIEQPGHQVLVHWDGDIPIAAADIFYDIADDRWATIDHPIAANTTAFEALLRQAFVLPMVGGNSNREIYTNVGTEHKHLSIVKRLCGEPGIYRLMKKV